MNTSERAVAVQSAGVRSPVACAKLGELARRVLVAQRVKRAMVSITLVNERAMSRMNREHLGHRGATDVITFKLGSDADAFVLADIYICPAVARTQALAHGVGVREEIARLVVHGMLHACGLDHPVDAERTTSPMWRRQEQLVARLWTSAVSTT